MSRGLIVECPLKRLSSVERRKARASSKPRVLSHDEIVRLLLHSIETDNARSESLPTYRIVTPAVCSLPSSVGAPGIEPGTPACDEGEPGAIPTSLRQTRAVASTSCDGASCTRTGNLPGELTDRTHTLISIAGKSHANFSWQISSKSRARPPRSGGG
jgi:hypothetical protein